ncbi:GNAT family N-acetyltransferase [Alkaliphilus transvaalensis]|uniref:GNAT family N-acetyltransferase n=1 Tax=Alkaliphilus transvaalensis TaxID=114628 RepID=UPI00047C10C8|nr:GNAT family protein [Alkaliphilus transvaalensis]
MFKHIIEEGLELKMLENNHAEAIFELVDGNREHLRQWLPWVDDNNTLHESRNFIKYVKKQHFEDKGFVAGIWYEGKLAGVIGFNELNWNNKSASIGYWLGAEFEGKGIMTKATKSFIDYAILELGFNRVEIRCAEDNLKSGAIPKRLGFTKEGVIREVEWLYDHYVNHIVYGVLAKDWKEKQ